MKTTFTTLATSTLLAGVLLAACGAPASPAAPAAPAATIVAAVIPAAATDTPAAPTPLPAAPAATDTAAAPTAEPVAPTDAPKPAAAAPAAGSARTYKISESDSKAQYSVDEVFFSQGNKLNTAIGVTSKINGEIKLDPANPAATEIGEITVDISTLQSDSGRRDGAIKSRWLESGKFPLAKFKPTKIEGLPATYKAGEELSFKMTGDMTVRDVTVPVTWDVKAKLEGDKLTGQAETAIKMSMFKFEAPNIGGMLKAEDDAKLSFTFVALPTS